MKRYHLQDELQTFSHNFVVENGGLSFQTFRPIEVWSERGLEIIPPGFGFRIPAILRHLIKDKTELLLFVLEVWRKNTMRQTEWAVFRTFRRELIKYTRKRYKPQKGHFFAYLIDRLRIELLTLLFVKLYTSC